MSRQSKQTFTKREIAHAWVYSGYSRKDVNGNSEWVPVTEGRTAGYKSLHGGYGQRGNQHFDDDKFYSYSTQIAQRYKIGDDTILYIIDNHNHSYTTNDQVRDLISAIPTTTGLDDKVDGKHYNIVRVLIDCDGQFSSELALDNIRWCFTRRVIDNVRCLISKTRTQRENRGYTVAEAKGKLEDLKKVYELAKVPLCPDIISIEEELNKVPEYVAKERKHNPNQRKYIRNIEEALQYLPNLPMLLWKKSLDPKLYGGNKDESKFIFPLDDLIGERRTISLPMSNVSRTWATIRVIGDKVVTSQGVRMPLMDAYFLYQGMLQVLNMPFGESINIGGYSISMDRFKRHGLPLRQYSVYVGCHNFHLTTIVSQFNYLLSHINKEKEQPNALPISPEQSVLSLQ